MFFLSECGGWKPDLVPKRFPNRKSHSENADCGRPDAYGGEIKKGVDEAVREGVDVRDLDKTCDHLTSRMEKPKSRGKKNAPKYDLRSFGHTELQSHPLSRYKYSCWNKEISLLLLQRRENKGFCVIQCFELLVTAAITTRV